MSIDKNTNEGKNYRNNVVKSTPGTSKSRINTGFPENISVLSPMMQEYCKTKETYKEYTSDQSGNVNIVIPVASPTTAVAKVP